MSIRQIINLLFVLFLTVTAADRVGRLRDGTAADSVVVPQRQLKKGAQKSGKDCEAKSAKGTSKNKKKSCEKPQHCNPACPCCSKERMPEFVAAIEAFSSGRSNNRCKNKECCYQRQDEESRVIFVTTPCNTNPNLPFYNTAFMSFDYTGTYYNCNNNNVQDGEPCKICGDSAYSNDPIILTNEQAAACEAVVRSSIQNVENCWSDEDGAMARYC